MPKVSFFSIAICTMTLFAANPATESGVVIDTNPKAFKDYWYQGKAELSRYQLEQARYGEIHESDAVMIFVTEDFLADRQVKHEFGDGEHYSVLKLNATRKFNTGLYPYSLMTSVFTKVDFNRPETAKVTFSGQEWCGHVFMQLNRKNKQFLVQGFSYFQSEGDSEEKVSAAPLEDDLWTQIRIAPNRLPTGNFKMLPSLWVTRLLHKPFKPMGVNAKLHEADDAKFSEQSMYCYTLTMEGLHRKLEIYFEKEAPFKILGWRDTYASGFGPNAKTLSTTAVKTHEIMTDYWSKNSVSDSGLRKELGLE